MEIIGNISNAIAAICAIVAIIITHKQYMNDKNSIKNERVAEKRDTLYKESVIDFFVNNIINDIFQINNQILKMSITSPLDLSLLENIYKEIKVKFQSWSYEIEIVKYFDSKLCYNTKKELEKVMDLYSEIINGALQSGLLTRYFVGDIDKELNIIRTMLFEKYLKML